MIPELRKHHADEEHKLHAFIMGAAASGVAFAIHETKDVKLDWWLLPIAMAVVAWAFSFAAGVLNRRAMLAAIRANVWLLEATVEKDQVKYDAAKERLPLHQKTAYTWQEAQLWSLMAGALLYVSGHVWGLAERETQSPKSLGIQPQIESEMKVKG